MQRANLFTVTEENKIKGLKDRRNILPLAEIQKRIGYDPDAGVFTYLEDCPVGKAGEDAVWRCRRTDNAGTPYQSTRYWEYVRFDVNHWYEPRRLAYYFMEGEWPPVDMWVASGKKYDYTADGLSLVDTGRVPSREDAAPIGGSIKATSAPVARSVPPKRGFWARLFGIGM